MWFFCRDNCSSSWSIDQHAWNRTTRRYAAKWRNSLDIKDVEDCLQNALVVIIEKYNNLPVEDINRLFHRIFVNQLSARHQERKQTWSTPALTPDDEDHAGAPIEYDIRDNAVLEDGFHPKDAPVGLPHAPTSSTMVEQIVSAMTLEKLVELKASPQEREIMSRLLLGDNYDEVADALRVSSGAVKSHMFRFRGKVACEVFDS